MRDGYFLCNGKVIVGGVLPVDQTDRNVLFAHARLHLHAIAQQAVDLAIGVVERFAATERCCFVQPEQRLVDDLVTVALLLPAKR